MKRLCGLALLGAIWLWPVAAYGQWSILDEIQLHDPTLSVDVIWELTLAVVTLLGHA